MKVETKLPVVSFLNIAHQQVQEQDANVDVIKSNYHRGDFLCKVLAATKVHCRDR